MTLQLQILQLQVMQDTPSGSPDRVFASAAQMEDHAPGRAV